MESGGLALEDFASPNEEGFYYDQDAKDWRFDLWADNWPAIHLYNQLSTQWRVGPNGAVGLDYNVLFHELDRQSLDRDAYDDLYGSIRVIEDTVLNRPA